MGRLFFKLITAFSLLSTSSYAKVLIVEPKESGKPLTTTFNLAQDGDTVLVKSGTYREGAMILKKRLTIIGENFPEIDGENLHENLLVERDSVIVKGLLFKNSGTSGFNDIAALKLKNSKGIIVEDCKFENNFFGIHTINCSYITYRNNQLSSNRKPAGNGIHCWKSNHLLIENNYITGHRDGIYLEFTTNSKFENNHSVKNSRYGMHFMFSHDNFYQNNEFRRNGAGVAVMYSKRVEMRNNLFAESWGGAAYGLLLKEINDSKIFHNTFQSNTIAIFADGANRIEINGNQFLKSGWALKAHASCVDMQVVNNNFIGNTFDVATNGNLVMKAMDGNYWDKYEGYDLDKDKVGDIPYHPLSLFSLIVEKNPPAMLLFRSFMVELLDKSEKILPSLTPQNFIDKKPKMIPHAL